jgi:8-oxo-dGTP pyrophosphatase MutT (NUDIX family)
MRAPEIQLKVAAYITRGDRLLVFRHRDNPEAGIQVPGGSVGPGEATADAALREAREETGLDALTLVAHLGQRTHDLPSRTGLFTPHVRDYYHVRCDQVTSEEWLAWETDPSDGSPGPIPFVVYWVPLDSVPPLAGDLDALLGQVGGKVIPDADPIARSAP